MSRPRLSQWSVEEQDRFLVLGERATFIGQRPAGCFWYRFDNAATLCITATQMGKWFKEKKIRRDPRPRGDT